MPTHWETCGMCDGDASLSDGSRCDACQGTGQVLVSGPEPGGSDDPSHTD